MSQGTELVTRFGNKGLNLLNHLPSPKIYSYIVIACMYCLTQIKREYWKTLFWQWPLRKKGSQKNLSCYCVIRCGEPEQQGGNSKE